MIKNKSNTQQVLKGISSQTLVTIGMGIVEIVYFSIMSRLLSREDFGLFAVITAISAVFYSISEAGIGSALIQQKEVTEEYKNTAFTLSLIIGCIIASIMIILAAPLSYIVADESLKIPLILMAMTIFINGMISVNISLMERNLWFLTAGFVKFVAFFLSSLIAIIMALNDYGLYAVLFKVIASSFLTLFISFFFIKTSFKLQLKRKYIDSILQFGGWLTASVIVHNISMQIDRLLMSRLISVEALGAYNRPKEFVIQIGTRINGIFDTVLFPVLSNIQDQIDSLRIAFYRSMYIMNICSMALSLFFICNAELLIRIFFGSEWMDIKIVFQIISLSLVLNINGRLGDCYLRSLGLVRQQFNLRMFELLLNIICILVGYHFDILGVAIGFLFANLLLIVVKTIYLSRKMQLPELNVLKVIFSGWSYGIYFIPLLIFQSYLIPNSWIGCISTFVAFIIMMILMFLIFPSSIGNTYKKEIYQYIEKFLPW